MRFPSLCLLAILFLPSPRVFAAEKWVHATSAHFDLYTDESEAEVRAGLSYLETARAFFVSSTSSKDPDGKPVRIIAFHSDADFYKYEPSGYSLVTAYSLPGPPDTIVSKGLKPERYEYIFLEYCQAALDQSVPKLPFWIRAGLAQLYSTLKLGDGSVQLGNPPTRSFAGASNMNMTVLISVDRSGYLESRARAGASFDSDTAFGKKAPSAASLNDFENFQLETWMLTHMVMFGTDYRAKAGQFISALSNGEETASAFHTVYDRSLQQVASDLRFYMKQAGVPVVNAKFSPEKPAAPQIQTMTKEEQTNLIAGLGKARPDKKEK